MEKKKPKINFLINHYFSQQEEHISKEKKKRKKQTTLQFKVTYEHKTEKALQYKTRICLQHTAWCCQTPIVLILHDL